jgi:fructose-bisphosphate aldolase class I
LGGIVFLSGGQTSNDAFVDLDHIIDRLKVINRVAKKGPHKWGVTFSYSRALQDPVLKAWAKNRDDTQGTQALFMQQLKLASAASRGELDESKLTTDNFVSHSQDL